MAILNAKMMGGDNPQPVDIWAVGRYVAGTSPSLAHRPCCFHKRKGTNTWLLVYDGTDVAASLSNGFYSGYRRPEDEPGRIYAGCKWGAANTPAAISDDFGQTWNPLHFAGDPHLEDENNPDNVTQAIVSPAANVIVLTVSEQFNGITEGPGPCLRGTPGNFQRSSGTKNTLGDGRIVGSTLLSAADILFLPASISPDGTDALLMICSEESPPGYQDLFSIWRSFDQGLNWNSVQVVSSHSGIYLQPAGSYGFDPGGHEHTGTVALIVNASQPFNRAIWTSQDLTTWVNVASAGSPEIRGGVGLGKRHDYWRASCVDGIYFSHNAGASWVRISTLQLTRMRCIGGRFYGINGAHIYMSQQGDSWVDESLPGNLSSITFNDIFGG
jgi:hypothetical protein